MTADIIELPQHPRKAKPRPMVKPLTALQVKRHTEDYLYIIGKLPDAVVMLITLFLFINAVAWLFLPFAIIGIKARMNRAHEVNKNP